MTNYFTHNAYIGTTKNNLISEVNHQRNPYMGPPDNQKPELSISIEDLEDSDGNTTPAQNNQAKNGILKKSESRGSKPFYLSFKDLYYKLLTRDKKDKIILNKISGFFKSTEITAIMGPSGCGKTSTLNFLTNRIDFQRGSEYSGEIFINSEQITTNQVANYSSYVMQDDVMVDVLTPVETLKFISKLKNTKSEEEHDADVNQLIEILKLEKCKNTRIGNPLRKGLSGGEKKRVSIGIEIMSNPSILFLDEPTSGLDSTTSALIIEFLKELAATKNMIIAFTIHQPSSNIFQYFNRMIIMNKGEIVYQGESQKKDKSGNITEGIIPYFGETLGIPLQLKANPCDAFMHVIEEQNAGIEGTHEIEDENLKGKPPLTELYKEKLLSHVYDQIQEIKDMGDKCTLPKKNSHHVSFCAEFSELLHRCWLAYIRNPFILALKCIMTGIYTFLALSIFWRLKMDYQGASDRAGFLFFYSINNFLSIIFGAILIFPEERPIFLREAAGNIYGTASYYLSKCIVETPLVLVNNVVYSLILYYAVNLREGIEHYLMYVLIFLDLAWFSHSMGYFLGTTFPDLNTATIITQFSVIPFFLFSGFLINVENMPIWLAWLQYFSPFRFSVEASFKNEYEGNVELYLKSQQDILTDYGLNLGKWNCLLCLFLWGLVYRILGGICLKLLIKKTG